MCAATTSPCASQASPAFRGVPHASTCALPVHNLLCALCEQNARRRPHRALHTRPPGEPIRSKFIIQPTFCPSAGSAHPPRAFPDRISLAQTCTWRPPAKHSTDLVLAAVQTRRGPQNSCGRYSAFVPRLVPSSSPFNPRTPACHDAYTPCHDTSTRRRGCAFPHPNRHFSLIPFSHTHTRFFSHTVFLSYTGFHSHTVFLPHMRFLLHIVLLPYTGFHSHTVFPSHTLLH